MVRKLSDRERQMLHTLREFESATGVVDFGALLQATGYKPATLRSYLSPKLDGHLVRRRADNNYEVKGARACDEGAFAALMTQKAPPGRPDEIRTAEEWSRALHRLRESTVTTPRLHRLRGA